MTAVPLVSVFLPTYRRGDSGRLEAALESVLAQQFRDFELLVADDGSTDSTASVLASFAARDKRVRVFRHQRNSGLPALRFAQLLPMATGTYCAHMFDDDVWYPHALAVLVDALEEHRDWEMTYGNVVWPYLLPDGTVARDAVLGREPTHFDAARLRRSNYISHVAVLLRREVLDRVGVYDPHILVRRLCDWDLWLRIASIGTIGHTDVLVGESNGRTTADSLGRTANVDPELVRLYMSLDRDALLHPLRVLAYPVDGLEVFGGDPPPELVRRAAVQFAAFYRQVGDQERADSWEQRAVAQHVDTPRPAAVVVLYNPPKDVLANVDSYRDQVSKIVAVDNSEVPSGRLVAELENRGVTYLALGGNRGIAAALNEGCRRARALGFDWALTFDQDSTATPGMVARLFECVGLEEFGRRVRSGETGTHRQPRNRLLPVLHNIAVVAPVWQQVGGSPVATTEDRSELDIAMTSGSLLNLAAFEKLGGFREDLFIDRVDSEYCLRAKRHGWRIVQRSNAVLLHRMGHLRKVTFPIPCWVTDYSPVRRYYMVRNLLEVRREYGREFPAWMALERRYWRKELLKIMLAERHRLAKVKMMIRGWADCRRGRFGRYEDLHPRRAWTPGARDRKIR